MTLITNPPPTVDYAPSELQGDLVAMQNLEVGQLLAITEIQISPSQQELHLQLLEKNQNDQLTDSEQQLLKSLRINADYLMLKKAYAWSVLKWKGYPIPELNQLPKE